jgi:hypothetical protein
MRKKLDAEARALLEANTQTAERAGERFRFTVPAVRAYPFQWFWDSCFHAIVWARFDVERAADELRSLLVWQDDSGFLPHVVFWNRRLVSPFAWHFLESSGRARGLLRKPHVTAGIQPPVIAQAVERVVDAGADGDFLARTLPALARYYRFLGSERDRDGDGLITIVSQFESGLDFSPAYDEVVGVRRPWPPLLFARARASQVANKALGFDIARIERLRHHQEDVLVNAIYGQGLRALARLAARAGDAELEAWASAQAARVTTALLERCYDERRGLFFGLAGAEERRLGVKTIHCLMPLVLPDLPRDIAARLVEHLTDPREFAAPFPVPSVALDEPAFTRNHRLWGLRFIWRGPLSMNTNWLLVHGLRQHGFEDVAASIAERSCALVERGGFNEFYDPLSGAPVGAPDFGWATLATDLWDVASAGVAPVAGGAGLGGPLAR